MEDVSMSSIQNITLKIDKGITEKHDVNWYNIFLFFSRLLRHVNTVVINVHNDNTIMQTLVMVNIFFAPLKPFLNFISLFDISTKYLMDTPIDIILSKIKSIRRK